MLYGCPNINNTACSITAIIGILNQEPNDCMNNPRKTSSSAKHCSGTSIIAIINVIIVNCMFIFVPCIIPGIISMARITIAPMRKVFRNILQFHFLPEVKYVENGLSRVILDAIHTDGIIVITYNSWLSPSMLVAFMDSYPVLVSAARFIPGAPSMIIEMTNVNII